MKFVQAGVSKRTGKAYNAFYSCDSRNGGCGKNAQASQTGQVGQPAGQATPNIVVENGLKAIFQQNQEILKQLILANGKLDKLEVEPASPLIPAGTPVPTIEVEESMPWDEQNPS